MASILPFWPDRRIAFIPFMSVAAQRQFLQHYFFASQHHQCSQDTTSHASFVVSYAEKYKLNEQMSSTFFDIFE
jgi:hypothetical protein